MKAHLGDGTLMAIAFRLIGSKEVSLLAFPAGSSLRWRCIRSRCCSLLWFGF